MLTINKMHNMLAFQVNIYVIALFICKKKQEKRQKSNYLKTLFLHKKASLKICQSPQFSIYLYQILTAGILDYTYVKQVCILRNVIFSDF